MNIRNVVECPPLSDSDIGPGPDHLDSKGWGDRGNLGCWAAAELRQSEDLKAVFEDSQGYRNQVGGPVWGSESHPVSWGKRKGGCTGESGVAGSGKEAQSLQQLRISIGQREAPSMGLWVSSEMEPGFKYRVASSCPCSSLSFCLLPSVLSWPPSFIKTSIKIFLT